MDFGKKLRTLTVLPFLAAVMIASAWAPLTNVVQVNARGMGTEYAQPWRSKVFAGIERSVESLKSRCLALMEATCGHPLRGPAIAGVAVLLTALLAPDLVDQAGMVAIAGNALLKARAHEGELIEEQKKLKRERADISNAVLSREQGKRTMTEDENKKFLAAGTRIAELDAEIVAATQMRESVEAANEAERKAPAVDDPDQKAAAAAAKVVPGKDNTEDDPKRGFKTHREFMGAVMVAGQRGRVDARLKPLATAGSDEQGEYSDPYGAFLIPSAFSPDILSVQAEGDPTAPLTRKMPMDAPSVKVNARVDKNHATSVSGGLVVYRHGETDAITPSRMKFEQLTFTAEDLVGAAHATENQITDSPSSFIALIADGFKDEFARKLLREKIRGTGAGGQYLGVLNSPALVTVAKETGQAADTIVKENIDKMESRLWGPDASDRIAYLANKTTYPKLASIVQNVGTGGVPVPYLTRDAGGWRLNGRRLIFTEVCSAVGDLGDIVLVNWAEYIEAMYQAAQQAESVHVRFLNHERTFKFWVRNCGMPWWSSVLTPEYGETLSPLVTLAAR